MKKIVALIALAGLAGVASAQSMIDVKARVKGTTDWLDTVDFVSTTNADAQIEIAVFYKWTVANGAIAMSTCVNSPVVTGWDTTFDSVTLLDRGDSTQHPDGRQGNFNFGGQRQASYTGGANDAGRLRIAAPNNTQANKAGGVSVKQNTPSALGTSLDRSNPALGFRFDITVKCNDNDASTIRTLIGTVPADQINSFNAYNVEGGTGTTDQLAGLTVDGVKMNFNWIIPAPASMALLGLGGLVVGRRRR